MPATAFITPALAGLAPIGLGMRIPTTSSGEVACGTCHKEHRGRDNDITFLTNRQCQSCHVQQFLDLSGGHPDFGQYPHKRRTRIAYDHSAHELQHFPDKGANISCMDCHKLQPSGRDLVLKGYENTCAQCHSEEIEGIGRSENAFTVFHLPGLDIERIKQANIAIGEWPEGASYDIDGKLSPFMEIMLRADKATAEALDRLPAHLDLSDLANLDDAQLQDVAKIVWCTKKLFYDVAMRGQIAVKEYFEFVLGHELSRSEIAALSAQLPYSTIQKAQMMWLPGLEQEVPKYMNGEAVPTKILMSDEMDHPFMRHDAVPEEKHDLSDDLLDGDDLLVAGVSEDLFAVEEEEKDSVPHHMSEKELMGMGGWYSDEGMFAIRYGVAGHGDDFVTSWMTTLGNASMTASAVDLFGYLAQKQGPGLCVKCHSIDEERESHTLQVNWNAKRRDKMVRDFTKFVHGPHLLAPETKDCRSCHQFSTDAQYMASYETYIPTIFQSDFEAIPKDTCVVCHTPHAAGDSCLNCHNYHIGSNLKWMASEPTLFENEQLAEK